MAFQHNLNMAYTAATALTAHEMTDDVRNAIIPQMGEIIIESIRNTPYHVLEVMERPLEDVLDVARAAVKLSLLGFKGEFTDQQARALFCCCADMLWWANGEDRPGWGGEGDKHWDLIQDVCKISLEELA
jgi:hypothetical protein